MRKRLHGTPRGWQGPLLERLRRLQAIMPPWLPRTVTTLSKGIVGYPRSQCPGTPVSTSIN
eukprot:6575573-Prymnesium_polylepis.1